MILHDQRVKILKRTIASRKARNLQVDYLEDKLKQELAKAPKPNDLNHTIFNEKYGATTTGLGNYLELTDQQVKEMQIFGYVLSGNTLAVNQRLRTNYVYLKFKNGYWD